MFNVSFYLSKRVDWLSKLIFLITFPENTLFNNCTNQIHVFVKCNKVSSQNTPQSLVSSSPYFYPPSLSYTIVKDPEWSFSKSYEKKGAIEFISS